VFVHGGGYGGGDKDGGYRGAGGPPRTLLEQAVREGFVAVNLNYILNISPGGIHPQVWVDYKNAIRFLRANAGKYHIDPNRIAAWGFSAGGWLSGSGSFTTADDNHPMPRTDGEADWHARRERDKNILLPLDDLRPPHAGNSSRLTAIVADFWPKKHYPLYTADDPAILTYVGVDAGQHQLVQLADEVGNEGVNLVLTGPKFKGKASLHVPPIDAACRSLEGTSESVLKDEALRWLEDKLVDHPRLVPPEARPNRRLFADEVTVQLIASAPDVTIRYTTDQSDPTVRSKLYQGPFRINETTIIKAIAEADGYRPSAIAHFAFDKGEPPPAIKGPDQLPPATVGQPYSVKFQADSAGPLLWNIGGHATPEVKMHRKGVVLPPLGLVLDPQTGVLSGVPGQAGAFTITIQVARGFGRLADVRDYVLLIRPKTTNSETNATR
jgi:hypothetical protein